VPAGAGRLRPRGRHGLSCFRPPRRAAPERGDEIHLHPRDHHPGGKEAHPDRTLPDLDESGGAPVATLRLDGALRAAFDRDHGAHLRAVRAADGLRRPRRRRRTDRRRCRTALRVRLAGRERPGAHPEPHPVGRAGDRGVPDDAHWPGGRPDRQQPLADRGHPAAGARARAPPRARGGRRALAGENARAADASRAMTACLFGTYDRGHSANRLLRRALADGGFAVEELHEPVWEDTRDKKAAYFAGPSLAGLAGRGLAAGRRLAAAWRRRRGEPPLVVVGFGGQLDVLLAARICRPRAALVFAPLVSLTETLVEDRGVFPAGGVRARLVTRLDRAALRAADLVLARTGGHGGYFRRPPAPRGPGGARPVRPGT